MPAAARTTDACRRRYTAANSSNSHSCEEPPFLVSVQPVVECIVAYHDALVPVTSRLPASNDSTASHHNSPWRVPKTVGQFWTGFSSPPQNAISPTAPHPQLTPFCPLLGGGYNGYLLCYVPVASLLVVPSFRAILIRQESRRSKLWSAQTPAGDCRRNGEGRGWAGAEDE